MKSVKVICTDAGVVSHESNAVLFDIVDRFHQELHEQFVRLTRRASGVRFGYYGNREPTPFGLEAGFSWEDRFKACDTHLEMNAEIAFRGRDLVEVTSYVWVRRNALPSELTLPNAYRGVLELWKRKIETGPFKVSDLRRTAHEHALILVNDFLETRGPAAR